MPPRRGTISNFFSKFKKKGKDDDDPFATLMAENQQQKDPSGRRTLQIAKVEEKITIDMSKVIDKLGNGAFGFVYLVCPKKNFK